MKIYISEASKELLERYIEFTVECRGILQIKVNLAIYRI
jgi:hypothetical protein